MAYITVEEFKKLPLGVSLKGMDDTVLEQLLEVASANVENFTERVFSSAYYTEKIVGNDRAKLVLWNYPITNYLSVKQTTISSGAVVNLDTTKFLRTTNNDEAGILELDGTDTVTSFSSAAVYEVYYRAGFATVPVAVKHATALWTTELLQPDYTGVAQGNVELIPATSEQITELLTRYKRRRL